MIEIMPVQPKRSREPAIHKRVSVLERDVRTHSETVSILILDKSRHRELVDLRLQELETFKRSIEDRIIRNEETVKADKLWQTRVDMQLIKMSDGVSRLLWLGAGSSIAAIFAVIVFLVQRGLHL